MYNGVISQAAADALPADCTEKGGTFMPDNTNAAQQVYDTVCELLTEEKWHFTPDPETLMIKTGAVGDDLPMEMFIDVNKERDLMLIISPLPFVIPEDKRIDFAIAVCAVNDSFISGGFDYDIGDGHLMFRLPCSFCGCPMSKNAALQLLLVACNTVDEYNDKFLALATGAVSLEEFLADV